MPNKPMDTVGVKIEDCHDCTFGDIRLEGPGIAVEIDSRSSGLQFEQIVAAGGGQSVRYADEPTTHSTNQQAEPIKTEEAPASKGASIGWSAALEANWPFKTRKDDR